MPEVNERAVWQGGCRWAFVTTEHPATEMVHSPALESPRTTNGPEVSAGPGPTTSNLQPFGQITVSLSLGLDDHGYSTE